MKPNATGFIEKLKATLCARGFRQIYGIDFTETHAPVTTIAAWRAAVAECARRGLKIDIWDVSGAYLNSELIEDIYVKPPEGMAVPEGCEGMVLKLKKALYGLKQAGRAWNQKLRNFLLECGFEQSQADHSMFYKTRKVKGQTHVIRLNVHVDDSFATYSDDDWYAEFKQRLEDVENGGFNLSRPEDGDVYIGIKVDTLPDGAIKIQQTRYIDDMAAKFLNDSDKAAVVPHFSTIKLTKDMCPMTQEAIKIMKGVPYRSLIGALNHIANCTRPDIAAAVGICAQFCENPGETHWKAAKMILRYLKGTREYGIIYGRHRTEHIPYAPLCGFADASWADGPERLSRSGIIIFSWGGPIAWRSMKQKAQALSTTEAEYVSACEATKSVVWLRRLFREFGYTDLAIFDPTEPPTEAERQGHKPSTIYEDNSGCIRWSVNPVQHQRAKHIDLQYHFVRAKVRDGDVKLVYRDTEHMVADLLTKCLASERFQMLRDMMVGDGKIARGAAQRTYAVLLAEYGAVT